MLESQPQFVQALRMGSKMRKHMFDTLEQQHTPEFWRSSLGRGVYGDLLSAVCESGVPDALQEFEDRFFPLVSSDDGAREERAKDRRRGGGSAIFVLCLAAALSALIVGVSVVKMTAAAPPVLMDASSAAARPAEGASPIVSDPAQTIAVRAAAPDVEIKEPGSETTSEPEAAASSDEKRSKED